MPKIRFDFAPIANASQYLVEKEDSGKKHHYLYGVSSGTQVDGHGERMTEECIKSFHNQAHSGDILLFTGKHDVNFIDDIGRLVESRIESNGDWLTGYRLYDEDDGFGPMTMERVDKVWRQVSGLPPYTAAKRYGFSIEGEIPDNKIEYCDSMGRRRIADVALAGTVLVNRPAYTTSVAHAVMKALNVPTPQEIKRSLMGENEPEEFYDTYCQITDSLDQNIQQIMNSPEPDKTDRLQLLFDEYSKVMIDLIQKNPDAFTQGAGSSESARSPTTIYETSKPDNRQALLVRLATEQDKLLKLVQEMHVGGK
jgi:hypothetical protein